MMIHTGTVDTLLCADGEERIINCLHSDWTGMVLLKNWLDKNLSKKQHADLSWLFTNGVPRTDQ